MPVSLPLPRLVGLLLILVVLGFLAWTTHRRVERVDGVTSTDAAERMVDAASPTGYTEGRRWLIVPEQHSPSYERIIETQQALATGSWRVRHVDHENAPTGRAVYSSSPYRWWLAGLARIDHTLSGRPVGVSVERAALWSEPLLHLLLLIGGGWFVRRAFGLAAAVWFALGAVFLFPLGGAFLPGAPGDRSLTLLCALGSVLPLVAGLLPTTPASGGRAGPRRGAFIAAGIAGGLGLWVAAPQQTWIIVGVWLGGLASAVIASRAEAANSHARVDTPPWRAWAWSGALTSTLAYFIEYAPAHLGLRLEVNHPLYGLAWIGLGELLVLAEARRRVRAGRSRMRVLVTLIAAIAAMATLPVALILLRPEEWWSGDLFATRLTQLPNGAAAANMAAWLHRDGWTGAVVATFAPLLLLIPAGIFLVRGPVELWRRRGVALCLGPIAVALVWGLSQLAWWSLLDGLLLAFLATLVAKPSGLPAQARPPLPWLAPSVAGVAMLVGLPQLLPPRHSGDHIAFTQLEIEALLERGAAHWLAERAGPDGAVLFLPPAHTVRWAFHGGERLRGIGSAAWENREGLTATIRIATAQTGEEAQALLQERGATHLVLPSWDQDLQQFARLALKDPQDAFIMAVHEWALPSWLQPLPYPMPTIPGFERAALVVLRVTDETNRATALARLLEYFIETNEARLADAAGEALRHFPADANALVAIGQLQRTRGQATAFHETLAAVLAGLEAGFDRGMPWDRRVSLAILLAHGERHDRAREQLERVLERLDDERISNLPTGALYRLQVLAQAYNLPIADPTLRTRARALLPEPLRDRLRP
jgi:tetratricopeptide (TPR) repeat protein